MNQVNMTVRMIPGFIRQRPITLVGLTSAGTHRSRWFCTWGKPQMSLMYLIWHGILGGRVSTALLQELLKKLEITILDVLKDNPGHTIEFLGKLCAGLETRGSAKSAVRLGRMLEALQPYKPAADLCRLLEQTITAIKDRPALAAPESSASVEAAEAEAFAALSQGSGNPNEDTNGPLAIDALEGLDAEPAPTSPPTPAPATA